MQRRGCNRPDGYRTPSPPSWSPILSPIDASSPRDLSTRPSSFVQTGSVTEGTLTVHDQPPSSRQPGHRSTGSMEAFASIALATQQGGGFWSSEKRSLHGDHSTDRAKRLRVEPSHPDITPAIQSGPTRNNDLTSSVQLHEAKLLLHFSQQARDAHQHPPQDPRNGSPSIAHPRKTVPISASGQDTVSNKRETQSNSPAQDDHVADIQGQAIPSRVSCPEMPLCSSSLPSMEQIPQDRDFPKILTHSPRLMKHSKILSNDMEDNILSQDIPIQPLVTEAPAAAEQTSIGRVPSVTNVGSGLNQTEEPPSLSKVGPNEASEPHQPPSGQFVNTDKKEGVEERTGLGNVSGSMDTGLNGMISGSQQAPSPAQECSNDPSLTHPTNDLSASTNVMEAANSGSSDPPTNSTAICEACRFWRNSLNVDTDSTATSWIHCDGCKSWFHFACAGFKNEREVRSIDKYRCKKCKPIHGATTHVRKSARAHTAIDYAGLHQGVLKTSDDRPEHHYIQPIRSGKISFMPEHFPRMRPELVIADFFEKGNGMREPVLIPAALNPQPGIHSSQCEQAWSSATDRRHGKGIESSVDLADWLAHDTETRSIHDCGQDALGMVMPRDLTVGKVAELYGPEEKVEVIDVKSQNGEGRKWNMRRWANYYESSQDNKIIRNVISLEVSQSRLGRLIRRPQIVRDLDLQDSVWPEDLLAKGEYPHVQFYCLMSVANCFTDFHIDFGGSSVFYHILKGRKTFLFIPPKEKHLKKYEEWCMSPAQNWTFLPDQTHECYRVDLEPGDTMLIPSGWIHAVWTPEDSLVIGGNFLTRLNYTMQFRVLQVEKATGVARKFRYPHFQKLHWFTVFQYLEDDPVPASVREHLENGFSFERASNTYRDFDEWGENSRSGPENYHARYYPQQELDGLPDLLRYVLRTALIDNGIITEGISADARNAVKKSIPRNRGEPLQSVKTFAIWCSWKRGNEPIPHWAYPDAVMESAAPDKLSAAATKKLAEEAALKAPRRQSLRKHAQRECPKDSQVHDDNLQSGTEDPLLEPINIPQEQNNERVRHVDESPASRKPRHTNTPSGPQRKTACDSCRRRRRACKHKSNGDLPSPTDQQETSSSDMVHQEALLHRNALQEKLSSISGLFSSLTAKSESNLAPISRSASPQEHARAKTTDQTISEPSGEIMTISTESSTEQHADTRVDNSSSPRPRTKACSHCRKSKRRCIHDAFGKEDPIKVAESAIPRPHARKMQRSDSQLKEDDIAMGVENSLSTASADFENHSSPTDIPIAKTEPVASIYSSAMQWRDQIDVTAASPSETKGPAPSRTPGLGGSPILMQHKNGHCIDRINPAWSSPERAEIAEDPGRKDSHHNTSALEKDPGSFSLASPPPSAHEVLDESPKVSEGLPSPGTSEFLQRDFQTYTPESGSVRRTSHSSTGEASAEKEKGTSSIRKPNIRGLSSQTADEESLKLIKELQAQDLGLRRRIKPS